MILWYNILLYCIYMNLKQFCSIRDRLRILIICISPFPASFYLFQTATVMRLFSESQYYCLIIIWKIICHFCDDVVGYSIIRLSDSSCYAGLGVGLPTNHIIKTFQDSWIYIYDCGALFLLLVGVLLIMLFITFIFFHLHRMNIQTVLLLRSQSPHLGKRGIQYSAGVLQRDDYVGV